MASGAGSWSEEWAAACSKIRSDLGYESSAEQLRELVKTGLLKLTDLKNDPVRFFEAHRLLARHAVHLGPGFWIRFTVHYNLFAGSVLAVGTDEQVQQLDVMQQRGLLGCFGLTEKLAGVNSGMVVNTTADWDDTAQEFIINSADVGAQKFWISQGLVGDLAVVVADLRIAGKSFGPHAFLMELRKDGKLVPNVELGDMGQKTVGNDLDNAWIAFNGCRIPHSALLRRYADVQPGNGGTYVSKKKGVSNMGMIGQRLFSGRVAVAQAALAFTRRLFESTQSYSDNKACWGPKGNTKLTNIPQLRAIYAHADKKLGRIEAFVGECEKRLSDIVRKDELPPVGLQEAIACSKIVAVESCVDLCTRLKQDVGSYALMVGTGFEQMDFLQCCKFAEGDSRILMQKLARDRVKNKQSLGNVQEQALVADLQQAMKGGPQAWDENYEKVYDLAWSVVTRIIDDLSPGEPLGVPFGVSKL
eukprot:TRINITY_DN3410_c0_g1_i2.p1 TRINITY_DN3410_c0_g1~~TRINITY_DN3410_c0_g1_i2.p1  ORF type:complete len:498 (-),score=104.87 TRINITY_DN3410_c0_g1_i2:197-1615(-)